MVAVVSGSGLGLGTSSLATLGAGGALGRPANGRGGDRLYVNSITGNLIIQRADDLVMVPGANDFGFLSTYNSQGLLANTFDNQDTWQFSAHKRVKSLTGTVNTSGSTITRVDGDGSETVYTYDTGRSRYVSTAGGGAHDSLTYTSSNQRWTWAADSGESTETYYALSGTGATPAGRIFEQADPNGQLLTYTYDTSGKLTTITNVPSGESLALVYVSGTSNVQEVRASVRAADGTLQTVTRVRYTYVSNRLESIRTDLTPHDNSVTDNNVYTTTFTYNANGLVSAITQSDGSSVSFTYVNLSSLWRVQTVTVNDGTTNRVTSFNYNTTTRITTLTDPVGQVTTLEYDTSQRLVRVRAPDSDAVIQEVRYGYDSSGNVTTITDGRNQVTTMQYDSRGNLTLQRDSMGNTVTRIYNTSSGTEAARNLLLSETSYTTPDADGGGSGTAAGPLVTRFVYDTNNNLRFEITNEGRVTEHLYSGTNPDVTLNTGRLRVATLEYAETRYTVPASATATISLASMNTWRAAAGTNRSAVRRTDYGYETASSRVSRVTTYTSADASGNGVADGTQAVRQFVYDAAGNLLQTVDGNGNTTLNTYDGLGRVLSTTQRASGQSSGGTTVAVNTYDDAGARMVTTLASGVTSTSLFNRAGLLLSVTRAGPAAQALGATTYHYDANGRLRMVTDPTQVRTHRFYDVRGRLLADVDGDGTLTERFYDLNDRLIKAVVYAVRVDPATLVDGSGNPTSPTLAGLRTVANGDPTRNRLSRSVYDNAGRLAYTVDEEGALTELRYDGAGRVMDRVQYANRVTIAAATDEVLASAVTPLITTSVDDRRTRYFYDLDGKLLATLDAAGYLLENSYDGTGHLTQALAYFNATPVAQRASGTLAALRPATDATRDLRTWLFYDGQGRHTGTLDAEGYLTEITYDRNDNAVQTIRYPGVRTYTGTPTLAGVRPATTTGAQVATAQYDELDRVRQQTNHEGTVTTFTYDAVGNLIASTRAQGTSEARTAEARYDFLGRVVAELTAEGRALITGGMTQTQIDAIWAQYAVSHAYDTAGRRISSTDQNGNRTFFYYDADGRVTHTINSLGEVQESRYNALGQLIEHVAYRARLSAGNIATLAGGLVAASFTTMIQGLAVAANDRRTTYSYTTTGRLASTTTAENGLLTHAYNAFGEESVRLQHVDATRQLEHRYVYDTRGLLTQTRWDPTGFNTTESRQYDAFGRLTQVTDIRGGISKFEYDRLGRTVATEDPLTRRRTATYDAFSRTLTRVDALNNGTSYVYDDVARRVTVTTPEGISFSTVHNRHGERVTVTDGRGNVTTYSYNLNGELTSVSDGLGTLASRTYDRAGRQVTETDARGVVTTIAYDPANRVFTRTVDTAAGGLALQTRYVYDGLGRVIETYDANNALTTMEYDRDGRVTAVTVDPSGPARSRTTYTYDRAGNILTVVEGQGSANPRTTEYQYDKLSRRTQEVVDPGTGKLNITTLYRYDAAGNVTRRIDANGHSTWYVYDLNDRLIAQVDPLGGVTGKSYDAEGRVTATRRYALPVATGAFGDSITLAQATPATDALDRRTLTVYDRDGRDVFTIDALGGVVSRVFDANGNVIRRIAYAQRITIPGTLTPATVQAAITTTAYDVDERAVFDTRNRAAFRIDALGGVTGAEYDAAGNVISATAFSVPRTVADLPTLATMQGWATSNADASRDRSTRTWYDAAGRAAFVLDAEGYVSETQYDGVGRPRVEAVYAAKPTIAPTATLAQARTAVNAIASAANDQRTTTDYDAGGRVTRVTDALGVFETFGYDALGNRTSHTNRKGATWTYQYDANSRMIYERTPSVVVTTVSESGGALVSNVSASQPLVTFVEYDALGNVRRRTEAQGTAQARTTEYLYDALGRQVRVNLPSVGVYNAPAGDELRAGVAVVRAETAQALYTETAYDALGNAFRNRDAAGNYSYKVYDALGRVIYDVDAEKYVTAYTYDAFESFGRRGTLVRYRNALGGTALSTTSTRFLASEVTSRLTAAPAQDRTITTHYDRLDRAVRVTLDAVYNFMPNAVTAGGTTFTASPTTVNEYNAFGEVVRQRELVTTTPNVWDDRYFYYDRRGAQTAQVDALGFLTIFEYDETGDLKRQVEYSRALAPGWNAGSYGTAVVTTPTGSPGNTAGYDREVRYTYDRLNRRTSQTRYNVEYTTVSGTTTTTAVGNQLTTYGYDAAGNQTRVTDHNNNSTYTYYSVLGYAIALAEPARDRGNGATLMPLIEMRRDAFGNMVEEIRYASGATAASETTYTASTDPTGNRRSLMRLDSHDHVVQMQDAAGAQRYASYNARGEVAKEWQPVYDADNALEVLVTIRQYDKLGNETAVIEPQRLGTTNVVSTREAEYNAFAEITRKGVNGGWQEYFDYDQTGRVWRSNSGDGVSKVFLYDLAGKATAEIRSQQRDLKTYVTNAAGAHGLPAAEQMRTETRYDLLGRIVEQRLPTFSATSGLEAIVATFAIGPVAGPSNPAAIYQRVNLGPFGGIQYFVNPNATLAQDGGYVLTESGTYVQDPNHAQVSAIRVTWDAPGDASVEAKFEYRVLGSTDPNAWASIGVGVLAGDKLGVNVQSLMNQTYEYRVTYRRRTETTAYAEATGTFRVNGTTSTTASIAQNPPDPASEVSTLSASHANGLIVWAAPGDTGVSATFRYKPTSSSTWTNLAATRVSTNFQVNVQTAMASAGSYDYEIIYSRVVNGSPVTIAQKNGTITSSGSSNPRTTSSTVTESTLFLDVDPVATPTTQVGGQVGAAIAASEWNSLFPAPQGGAGPPKPVNWEGGNNVSLQWANIGAGQVRVELDYLSQEWAVWTWLSGDNAWDPQPQPAVNVSNRQFTFTGGAATGATLTWSTPDGTGAGGIQQINAVRVYLLVGSTWVLQYSQSNPTPVYGRGMSWAPPSAPAGFAATFEYKLQGSGTWSSLAITQGATAWGVNLNGLSPANYDYRITYSIGGRTTAQRIGTLAITNSSTSTTTSVAATPASAPSAPEAVGTLAGVSGSPAATTSFSSAQPAFRMFNGESQERWFGTNAVTVSYASIGAQPVRVMIWYVDGTGIPSTFPASGPPTTTYSNVPTSVTVSWSGTTAWDWSLPPGGISSITRVQVLGQNAQGAYTVVLRDTAAPAGGAGLNWAAPTLTSTQVFFEYRTTGGSWTARTATRNGSTMNVDLTGLSGTYEYRVRNLRSGEAYASAIAEGSFSVSGTTASVTSQTNTQTGWLSGVSASGTTVNWTQAPVSGASVTFEYFNGSSWVGMSISGNGTNHSVNFAGFAQGSLSYRIRYTRAGQIDPYLQTSGTVTVTVTTTTVPATVTASTTSTATYPAVRITPVNSSGDRIYWTHATAPPGTTRVELRYFLNGVWNTQVMSGSGPSYEFFFTAAGAGNHTVWYEIDYYRGTETDSYARADGRVNLSVTFPTVHPTITVNSQTPVFPSGMQSISAPTYLGNNEFGWTTAGGSANVVFRYQPASGGLWTSLPVLPNGTGYKVSILPVASGTYNWEITYTTPPATNPYAMGRGTFTVTRNDSVANYTQTANPPASPPVVWHLPRLTQALDRWGNALSVTDAAGRTTDYRYDQLSQLVETRQAETDVVATLNNNAVTTRARPTTRNYFDLLGRLIATRDANGNLDRVTRNAAGQTIVETHADTGQRRFTYDAFGNQVEIANELGLRTRNTFNGANFLTQMQREVVSNGFGTAGPNDIVVDNYDYDESGRRITETNGENETTRYYYDLHGNVRQRRTPLGRNTTYEYDLQGRKTREVNPIGGQLTWAYTHFGKMTAHADLAGVSFTYTYDSAGGQLTQTSTAGQNIVFGYDEAGHMKQINDTGVSRITTFTYDASGRRKREKTRISGRTHQDTAISYDELGRVRTLSDLRYGLTYSYDAQGNRTRIAATYYDHEQTLRTQDLWYTYDAMNRVLISQGANAFGTIGINTAQGVRLSYNLAGQRRTTEQYGAQYIQHYQSEVWNPNILDTVSTDEYRLLSRYYTDTHSYDGLGRLTSTTRSGEEYMLFVPPGGGGNQSSTPTAFTIDTRVYDKASREVSGASAAVESQALVQRSSTQVYNDDGHLLSQTNRKQHLAAMQNESVISYNNDAAGVLRGYTVQVYNTGASNTLKYTSTYTNSYRLGDGYQESGQSVSSSGSGAPQSGSTSRGFNANGELISFSDSRDANKNRYFANGASGSPLTVVQGNYGTVAAQNTAFQNALARRDNSVKAQHFFFANGQNVGSFGQLQDAGVFKANFDVNYTPISSTYPSIVPAEIIVQSGDTLRSLAARTFGDATLWYILAEENGLSNPDEVLVEGTLLRVPNEVITLGNGAGSFKPFDMTQALGDTTPTQPMPPPPKKGCGVLGMIIMIVVVIIVTIYTAGAMAGALNATLATTGGGTVAAGTIASGGAGLLSSGIAVMTGGVAGGALGAVGTAMVAGAVAGAVGSVVGQGLAIAAGIQDEFSWKSVALGAVGGGIGAGLANSAAFGGMISSLSGGNAYFGAALGAASSNMLSQGVGMALGLQEKFDWRSVAISAVSAPLAQYVGTKVGAWVEGGAEAYARVVDSGRYGLSRFAADVTSGFTAAGVRMALGGKVDVTQVVADVFGNALANSLVSRMRGAELPESFRDRSSMEQDEYRRRYQQMRNIGVPADQAGALAERAALYAVDGGTPELAQQLVRDVAAAANISGYNEDAVHRVINLSAREHVPVPRPPPRPAPPEPPAEPGVDRVVVTGTRPNLDDVGITGGLIRPFSPALVGTGEVLTDIHEGYESLPRWGQILVEGTATLIDVASGPVSFGVRKAFMASPAGAMYERVQGEAAAAIGDEIELTSYGQYSTQQASMGGVAALSLLGIVVEGARSVLRKLGGLNQFTIARRRFTGMLRGRLEALDNISTPVVRLTKRDRADVDTMRRSFNRNGGPREQFLQDLANDPNQLQMLRDAGLSQRDITRMADGYVPEGFQVHHKVPLEGGGTNDLSNLVLIRTDPYHQLLNNYQRAVLRDLSPGDTLRITWPTPDGSVYVPPRPPVP